MTTGPTLVTGATGFAGGHLLDRLADRAPVVAWYRPDGQPPDPERHIDWRPVDLLDSAAVTESLLEAAPSRIYHLAGAPQVDASWRTAVPHLRTNVLGTHHLLEAVKIGARTCRVLIVSSAQVYQASDDPISEGAPLVPPSPYGLSKLAQDRLGARAAAEEGLDVIIARPFNHAGPRQSKAFAVASFARQIARIEAGLASPEIRVGNLDARRDITDVRDVVEAYECLMMDASGPRPYNICSGRAWRIGDLLEELTHIARVPVKVVVDPQKFRPNDVPVLQGDASRIRADLGWTPKIPVEQMLADTLDWWRAEVQQGRDN